jgi:alpha-D-xyloside xylohydrolase
MKFTNGYWMAKEGVSPHFAVCAYEAEQQGDELVVFAPERQIRHRGDTLNAQLLTIRYSSPMHNIIRVRISHFEGEADRGPHFSIESDTSFKPVISITQKEAVLKSGDLSVRVELDKGWNNEFIASKGDSTNSAKDSGEKVLSRNLNRSTAYMITRNEGNFIKEELSLSVDELVYGLGERFGPLVKNGQSVDIWNADGGTASEQAYKNVPFYMTSRGYGVFINNSGKVSLEIGSEKTSRVQFCVPGEILEYYIIYGPEPKTILELYTGLTGRPATLPEWSYGLWLSTSFTTSYDENTVMSFINGMEERQIPLSVFHFDCFWMKGFSWCDFTWESKTFPDPKGLLSRIKAKGIKICVWINPYIAQRSPLFEEGKQGGYFLKCADCPPSKDGAIFQTDLWQAGMAIVDFTNPDAVRWFCGHLEKLLDMGVDCFKTDFGERIPDDAVYYDRGDPVRHHNYYSFLYNKAVFELLERKRGKGKACLFARSATAGSQRFPLHWGGDCESTFEAMAETLRGGLSLALSGFGFWSHDIGGFEGTPNAALFKRWLAFGLLSSHSRLHGSYSYRVPWNVDEESAEVCRFFAQLKARLLPYILESAREASDKGIPVLRAMFLEFPNDPACAYLDRQYMLGPDLLVAPVFSEVCEVSYYLPEGEWTRLLTGETVKGGAWRTEKHGFLSLPLLIRATSSLLNPTLFQIP